MMHGAIVGRARTVNVLLDDDDGDAKSVQRAFTSARISNPIFRAIDGIDALDILRGTNGKPKLASPYLLLVDRIELVEALRNDRELHSFIAVMLTTSNRDEDKIAACDFNVAGYIPKKHAGQDFQRPIDMMQGYWRIVELP